MNNKWKFTLASLLTALVLFFGLNSFTAKEKKVATETPYYWYNFDNSGNQVGTLLNPGSKVTKTVAQGILTPCPDGNGNICIIAFDTNDKEESVVSTTPEGTHIVREE